MKLSIFAWKLIGVWCLWLLCINTNIAAQNPEEIPSPRPEGWVVDQVAVVPDFAKEQLNQLCDEIHQFKNAELAVVVIPTTGGQNHRRFATELFNHWGIGDARENNGVLLLVAYNDRKAELVLGIGVDTDITRTTAQRIMDNYIIPRFREGDVAGALYGGAFGSARDILGITDLATKVPQGTFDMPQRGPTADGRVLKNRQGRRWPSFWIWMAGGLLGAGGISLIGSRYYVRYRKRNCPECSHEMTLLEEYQDDVLLEEGEKVEERVGSADYDVWACLSCDHSLKIRYGVFFTRYSRCPECSYKTKNKVERVIVQATTENGGRVRVDEHCAHCTYHHSYTYSTPRVTQTSSSSSSSSGFSSGGGFSGGGSGFGGGSSSGGGASGGW